MFFRLCWYDDSHFFQANFERDGGNGSFPPPSLHALLSCYLIQNQGCSDLMVHRIVQYLFLDMASCLSKKDTQTDKEIEIVENLIKYPSAFSVPPSFIKLTQVSKDILHDKIRIWNNLFYVALNLKCLKKAEKIVCSSVPSCLFVPI